MIIHVARLWEKYLSKCGLIKHTCSWPDKLFVLWIKIVKIYIIYKCYLACYFPIIFSYINLWCPVSHICDNSNRSQSWVEIKSLNFRGFKVLIKFYPCHLNKSPTIYYKSIGVHMSWITHMGRFKKPSSSYAMTFFCHHEIYTP